MNKCKKVDPQWYLCAKKWILGGDQKICADHCPSKLSIIVGVTSSMCRCPNLTIQHPVVAVMGCQLPVCVMYSTCNLMDSQLVFLEIEANLYLQFEMVSSRNTVQFLNEIDWIREC